MVTGSPQRQQLVLATNDPVQAANYAIEMTSDVVTKATDWGLDAAFALMGTVAFFCLITFFFRKL